METIDVMMNRRSIRKYADKEIPREVVETILKAGMAAPTATNAREWSFVVVRDPETLNKMADANGRAATPLKGAKLGILICGDLERAFKGAPDYWIIDCAIAGENMTIAAEALGLGSVWLGTWPQVEKVQGQRELFDLPEHIVPHSIIAFGYPAEGEAPGPRADRPDFEEDRVHYEKW